MLIAGGFSLLHPSLLTRALPICPKDELRLVACYAGYLRRRNCCTGALEAMNACQLIASLAVLRNVSDHFARNSFGTSDEFAFADPEGDLADRSPVFCTDLRMAKITNRCLEGALAVCKRQVESCKLGASSGATNSTSAGTLPVESQVGRTLGGSPHFSENDARARVEVAVSA